MQDYDKLLGKLVSTTPHRIGAIRNMNVIREIIIHCSATREGRVHDADDIHRWHQGNGWAGIGYHYVIRLDGVVEAGRALTNIGAHTLGRNEDSIGIVYIGGVDADMKPKDTRTPEQRDSMKRLVHALTQKFDIAFKDVRGHSEFAAKACPSFNVADWVTNELVPWSKYAGEPTPILGFDEGYRRGYNDALKDMSDHIANMGGG